MTPIVDTHQHLWDLAKLPLSWLPEDGPLAGSHTMADYLREAEGLNIVRAVYMEVDVGPGQEDAEADYVLDLIRRDDNPMDAAVLRAAPGTDGFAARVERYAHEKSVKGYRQVLHGGLPPGTCLKPEFARDMRLLGDRGLRFDLCVRAAELPDAAKLAALCPDTRFVLDHCGNPDPKQKDLSAWRRDLGGVAGRPNVVCKVSGIVAALPPGAWGPEDLAPVINACRDAFGPDRLMFASDWPVCTLAASLAEWVRAAQAVAAAWPAADRRKLFHDNAVRFYEFA